MIIKTRPKAQLLLPRELVPGQDISAVVVLTCPKAVAVDDVNVTISGSEYWPEQLRSFLTLEASLGGQDLSPGEHKLPFRFRLPEDAPASYLGKTASIRYEARVHVDVPWWPDRRSTFMLHVARPPVEAPEDAPKRYSSNPKGPIATEPHAEFSLASDWARPGDFISGAVALFNTEFNTYEGATVGIRSSECCQFGFKQRVTGQVYLSRLRDTSRGEGSMMAFRLRVPPETAPGFSVDRNRASLFSLEWEFEVEVAVRRGKNLLMRVPFRILPPDPGAEPRPYEAPPVVGTNRIGDVWRDIGARYGLEFDGTSLTARHGRSSLEVSRAHRGQDGVFVEARVEYPSLGLELRAERAKGIRRVIGGGVLFGDPEVDPHLYVEARDDAQAKKSLEWALLGESDGGGLAKSGVAIVSLDDTTAVFELEDDGSTTEALESMLSFGRSALQRLDTTSRTISPPTRCAETLPEWEKLAGRLGGELQVGALRISADHGASRVEVQTLFDASGQADGLSLEVIPRDDLEVDLFECHATTENLVEEVNAAFAGEVREVLLATLSGASYFRLEPKSLTLHFSAPLGLDPHEAPAMIEDAQALDGERVASRVARVTRIVALLRHEMGPYR